MEVLLAVGLLGVIGYLLSDETLGDPIRPLAPRGRLCDYQVAGGVYEPLSVVLARGSRLYEAHVYSDEQDHPVVALRSLEEIPLALDPPSTRRQVRRRRRSARPCARVDTRRP